MQGTLDHVGHREAAQVQQGLDVQVIGRLRMMAQTQKQKVARLDFQLVR